MTVQRFGRFVAHVLLILACLAVLLPVYWMVVCSVEPNRDILSTTVHWLPTHFEPGNFKQALQAQPFARFFVNSVCMSLMIIVCQIATSSLAAYALVFMNIRRKKSWLFVVLLAMMVPMQATFIPVYLILNSVHLINTPAGLVLPFSGSAFGIFLLRQGFVSIPKDLIHAARVDGASEWRILWSMVVPNAKPMLITLVLLNFVFQYNDLFWPLVATNTTEMRVIPVALSYFLSQEAGQTRILTLQQSLVKSGNALVETGPNYWDLMTQDFIKGKISMDIDSIGDAAAVKQGVGSKFQWGTAFLPSDKTRFVPPGGGDMAVMAGISSDHVKAAETFIEWWTAPTQTLEWSKLTGYLPVQKAAVSQPSYQSYLKQNPQFQTAINELKYQHAAPPSENLLGVLQNVQLALQGIFDEGKSVESAMDEAVQQANNLLQ